jgi:hypothetical protein
MIQLIIALYMLYAPSTFAERFEPALREPLLQVRFTIQVHAHDAVRSARCSWLQHCVVT